MSINGHRGTEGVPLEAFALDAGVGVLPVVPGVRVATARVGADAYPAAPSGSSRQWPPVSVSSVGPPWWERRQWRWPSLPTSIRAMRLAVRPLLDLTGLPHDELDDLVLATAEAASNAIEHATVPELPFFDVCTEVAEVRARIVVQDHGRWRTPTAGGDRGRGLQMVGMLADATLTVGARGTTVVLRNRPRSLGDGDLQPTTDTR
jgi:anti-sigma regulatory factor (Ser/Thr protein kinase)